MAALDGLSILVSKPWTCLLYLRLFRWINRWTFIRVFCHQEKDASNGLCCPRHDSSGTWLWFVFFYAKHHRKNYDEALRVGFETLIVATVIASAIIISTSVGKILKTEGFV